MTLVGMAALAAGMGGCGAGMTAGACGAGSRVPLAPAGVYVDDDVADGYARYASTLAGAGMWEPDATYGVHWCPARPAAAADAYRPYVSGGHWTTSEGSVFGSAPGTPYWASDEAAAWTDITAHHGWWIDLRGRRVGAAAASDEWCWIPGAEETPARVVWREGDGFVGWAPEPPTWVDDGGDDVEAGFEWTYELLGTLLEDIPGDYVLGGDAAVTAADATAPTHRASEPGISRRAPAKPVVNEARRQLVAYLSAHPEQSAVASAAAAAAGHASSPGHASSTSGTGSTTSSSGASSHKQESDDPGVVVVAMRLPPAGVLMPMMMADPALAGPAGVGPAGGSEHFAGGGRSGSSGGSSFAGVSMRAAHSHSTWTGGSHGGAVSSSYRSGNVGAVTSGSSSHGSSRSGGGSSGGHSSAHSSSGHRR